MSECLDYQLVISQTEIPANGQSFGASDSLRNFISVGTDDAEIRTRRRPVHVYRFESSQIQAGSHGGIVIAFSAVNFLLGCRIRIFVFIQRKLGAALGRFHS